MENLLEAWKEFVRGKRSRNDVQEFELNLMSNIINLYQNLVDENYRHGEYEVFNISDPKPRIIHKASVRDRLLHHAIYRKLYPFFDKTFSASSFSCRDNKGTHKALNCFRSFTHKASENNTENCWILKCDVKKFFASVDHAILVKILKQYIPDKKMMRLLEEIIDSFNTKPGIGLPLGNLTSQLFANIYLNELDQFIKHKIKAKYYVRYADDFVLLSQNKMWLEKQILKIRDFLKEKLHLEVHPSKLFLKTLFSSIDFLGWVHFPYHRALRTKTKKRLLKKIRENPSQETIASYTGLLRHGDTYKIQRVILG